MKQHTPAEISELLAGDKPQLSVYFVGIGGCGMSGLAHMMLDRGCAVAGSDLVSSSETEKLSARGAVVHLGHAASQLQAAKPDLVVYTPAIRRDNPEVLAASQLGVPIIRRAVLLAALLNTRRGICVAGMHGKTTTSALLAFAMERLVPETGYAIGAAVPQLARSARMGGCDAIVAIRKRDVESTGGSPKAANWFVAETDESDGTLSLFTPEHAVVLNVDEEHLDYYANLEAICADFDSFASRTTGSVVYCADDPNLVRMLASRERTLSYGFNPSAHYRIEWPSHSAAQSEAEGATFEIFFRGESLGQFRTRLLGEKNVSNAAGAVALLHNLGHGPSEIARAIEPFAGAARRQQFLFNEGGIRVVDDYGHHPQEIGATLRALGNTGCQRMLVAFQPHRYTRTRALLGQFAKCFASAEKLWIAEVYAASEDEIPGATSDALATEVRATDLKVECVGRVEELVEPMLAEVQTGDLVVFMGAGDITKVAHLFACRLEQNRINMKADFYDQLRTALSPDSLLRRDEPMARRTTLRVGGPADFFVEPASEAELKRVLELCKSWGVAWRLLGRGSNMLVRDGGFNGVIVSLGHAHFSRIEVEDGLRLRCGAGARLKDVAHAARRNGIGGLEFFEGIPGSVGGALRMNAGAMGASTFELVETLWFMDHEGLVHTRSVSEVPFQYRCCPMLKEHIALGAVFRGVAAAPEEIQVKMEACSQKRWTSQPKQSSAGCMFKNPAEIPAGKLIDELGLKGLRVGGAMVSDVHSNFIVNDGEATSQDVIDLIELVRSRVKELRGIDLHTEVEIIGEKAKMH